jgi:arylsulfatase
VAQGGAFGGWSLYVKEGAPTFQYNYLGLDRPTATASEKLPKGKSTVKMDFAYDGGKPGAGGTVTLFINDKSVGTVDVPQTQFSIFSADETAGVGLDAETPVSEDYTRATSKFTGTIHQVVINLKD